MEPVSSVVSAILKLAREIARAAKTARRNRERCRHLAGRAEAVGSVLEDSKERARADAAPARRRMLGSLKGALDDALELVESCRARGGGVVSWLRAVVTSGSTAARFDDVERRINACLFDLGFANGASIESKIHRLAARDHPRRNKPKQNQISAGNGPPKGGFKNNKNGGQNKGGQDGGKGGKKRRGKKAAAAVARPTPPQQVFHAGVASYPNGHGYAYAVHHHSMEEDPNSCSVM